MFLSIFEVVRGVSTVFLRWKAPAPLFFSSSLIFFNKTQLFWIFCAFGVCLFVSPFEVFGYIFVSLYLDLFHVGYVENNSIDIFRDVESPRQISVCDNYVKSSPLTIKDCWFVRGLQFIASIRCVDKLRCRSSNLNLWGWVFWILV